MRSDPYRRSNPVTLVEVDMTMQSVLRSLQVLEAVAEHQPVRVGQLVPLLGLPKSTIQRSLETLAHAGWLRPVDGDLTRWALAPRAHALVMRSAVEIDLREAAIGPMRHLRDTVLETVHLFVPSGKHRMVAIERVESPRPVRTVIALGSVFPMAGSAAGMAVLAHDDDDEVASAIDAARQVAGDPQPAALDKVVAQVAAARVKGYSFRLGWDNDMYGLGSAILDRSGRPVAGVSTSVPVGRYKRGMEIALGAFIVATADEISRAIGFEHSPRRGARARP